MTKNDNSNTTYFLEKKIYNIIFIHILDWVGVLMIPNKNHLKMNPIF